MQELRFRQNGERVLIEPGLPKDFEEVARGKVRHIYKIPGSEFQLLFVATDRMSAYDVIMNEGIPYKGQVLNQLSVFWFRQTRHIAENHFVTEDISHVFGSGRYHEMIKGRSMIVEALDMIPVELVVRGYLTGSGLKDYKKTGEVCGIPLPPGLVDGSRLDPPLFTPATKATTGHDQNIPFERFEDICEEEHGNRRIAADLRNIAIAVYGFAADFARRRGIIIADSKIEAGFRLRDGRLAIGDELFTPDSSRFWLASDYLPGRPPVGFDKQPLRDYVRTTGWNMEAPPPHLPEQVVAETSERYMRAYELLTGELFSREMRR